MAIILDGSTFTPSGNTVASQEYVTTSLNSFVDQELQTTSTPLFNGIILSNLITSQGETDLNLGTNNIGFITLKHSNTSLGVGTAIPSQKLDVDGNIRLTGQIRSNQPTMNFLTDGGNSLGVKVASLVVATSSDNYTAYTAPVSGAYIDGNVGIGIQTIAANTKLQVAGNVRTSGQLISTTTTNPPFVVSSTQRVPNLNADRLNGFFSTDYYKAIIRSSGSGVVSGCLVSSSADSSRSIKVQAGEIMIKDYGPMTYPGIDNLSVGEDRVRTVVFISGVTQDTYTRGGIAIAKGTIDTWPDMGAYAQYNPIILSYIYSNEDVILDTNIFPRRKFISIQYDETIPKIIFLKADRRNASLSSSSGSTFDRLAMYEEGGRSILSLTNLPATSSITERVYIDGAKIEFMHMVGEIDEPKNITPAKIAVWDDAGSRKHTHFYGVTPSGTINGTNVLFSIPTVSPAAENTRVYKNGLRQALGVDYTQSGQSITFAVAPLTDDILLIDYDL